MNRKFLTLISLVFAVAFSAAGILLTVEAGNITDNSVRTLSVEKRVAYQQKIEAVYWRHRVWNNSQPKPKLEEVLPLTTIQTKVEDGLRKSNALEKFFNRPISTEQLRAEVERMTHQTRNAEMLGELFAALDNDSFLIAEIMARPALSEAFLKDAFFADARFQKEDVRNANGESANLRDETAFDTWWREHNNEFGTEISNSAQSFELPVIAPVADDTWSPMTTTPNGGTDATAVWTGVEVIVWNSGRVWGSRYNPATDMTFHISRTNAPPARTTHTAVWTGQEMIIWGGYGGAAPFDAFRTGWRYNPTTDAWTQTSAANAPEARDAHVSVWTGTEMIVWGGWNPTGTNLNSGGRYNPSNDTWTPTNQTTAPLGRLRATAVWTGTEMIIWGGTISNVGPQNTGGRYNPATDTWTATSTTGAPEPRFNHTAVWTGTEMIVWGGNSPNMIFNTGGRYNPATDSWTALPIPAIEQRRLHTAVWTGTEMIVFGGCIDFQCSISRGDGSRYNPATNTWTTIATAVGNNRSRHAAVWTGTEMIVAGGCRSGQCSNSVSNIIRYEPSTNMWREARFEPIPVTPRQPHKAVWTGTEMLVWGVDASVFDTSVYRFDPTTNRWTRTLVANAPNARFNFSMVWTGMEMIVWGGDIQGQGVTATGGRFNPMTNTWTETNISGAPSARENHEAVWTGTEMIVWGGNLFNNLPVSGGRYNPATDTWTPTSTTNAPTGRISHTIIWSGQEMIVWGGSNLDASISYNSGGRYNPASNSWTATSTANAPTARNSHTAVWTGAEMIVWGGMANGTPFNTGGRYNPAEDAWTATSLTNAPSPRWIHTAIWTGTEMVVWGGIINGASPFQSTNTGGRYNPSAESWQPTSLLAAPDKRNAHTAVWTGSQMIIWGGSRDPESGYVNTGSTYNVETGPPTTPTPTPSPTSSASPTPTPTPTPTSTPTPTPSNGAGSLDVSFGTQGKQLILIPNINEPGGLVWNPPGDLAFQPDGKILVGGSAYNTFTGFDFTVTRLNTDGSLDSSFANNGVFRYDFAQNDDVGLGIVLQPDGKIILAGEAYLGVFNSQVDTAFGIIRLNPNGTLDSTFGTGGVVTTNFFSSLDSATEVALQPDGKIIATGYVTQGGVNDGSTYDFALVRYNPNGSIDATFGNGGKVTTDFNGLGDRAQTSVLQPDGKIVLAGWVYGTTVAAELDFGLARYNTDGSLDTTFDGDGKVVTTFGTNLNELARGMALAPDGKIVVAGDVYNPPPVIGQSGHSDVALARYNTDGSLDGSFDGDGRFIYDSNLTDRNEDADDVVVQPDGKILIVGGSHLIVNAVQGVSDKDMMVIRLNANGSFDNSFGNNGIVLTDFGIFNQPGPPEFGSGRTGDTILRAAIGLQPDGKIVATCDSTLRRAHHRLAIARYLNDTPILNPTINGRMIYANGLTNIAVPFAALSADGSVPLSAMTDSNGSYSLSGFGSGAYTVMPSKSGQVNGISNLDASRIAQHIVGLVELNEFQLMAADTSGNGTVGALDAAYIAQYVASIANPGQTGMWKFLPASRSYADVLTSRSNQDYSAILVGDVTGNWNPSINDTEATAERLRDSRRQAVNGTKTAAVETTTHISNTDGKEAGLTVELSAKGTTGAGILGYQFEVHYDAALVTPQIEACDVSGTVSREMTAVCNISQPGMLKVVVFGTTVLRGEGTILKLKFDPLKARAEKAEIRIENFVFNESEQRFVTVNGTLAKIDSINAPKR